MSISSERALYARVLGSSWGDLAEPIRFIHTTASTVHAHGRLRITPGHNRAARLVGRLLGLPRASGAAETRLVVTPHAGAERWHRTFGERRLDTLQYDAGGGELAERIGCLELRFLLEVSGGSLLFRQVDAALRFGSRRLRLPAGWAPAVDAREDAAGPRRITIHVNLLLPAFGPLLTYDGTIDIEEPHA